MNTGITKTRPGLTDFALCKNMTIFTDKINGGMKELKHFIIIAAALLIAVCGYAQQTAKRQRLYVIDGRFFKEIPMDRKHITGMLMITTANGTKAMGLTLSEPLPDDALRYALPKDSIAEADILLEMYEEKKSNALKASIYKEDLLKTGDKFPEFKATDIDGKTWSNADAAGKVMVLNCWFTGCGPCRAEMPELSEWKTEMPDVMFFSSTYEKAETARPILESRKFNWTALVNDRQFKNYIGANGYPMTIVIDKKGIIRQVEYGTSPLQREKLKQTIKSLR